MLGGTNDDAWMREFLAPLVASDRLRRRTKRKSVRRTRVLIVALAMVATTTGAAIAEDIDPFDMISSASHPQMREDVLDSSSTNLLEQFNERRAARGITAPVGAETARVLRELPDGRRVYVLRSNRADELCVLVQSAGMSCGSPLSQDAPTTVASFDRDGPGGWRRVTFGVAQDGVVSVSFVADGIDTTVPVTHNVWYYEGESEALSALTIHYLDGTTRVGSR